ncbi:hypothetical protein [Azorhizobium caulinodans]|uniref:hypothetical protein n=1 Tax=Azorhizobium caulinodans TaxID=7 RepID=UPI002FBDD89C
MNDWSRAVLAPVLLAGAVVASGAALAQGLPDSRKMSCAQATGMVRQQGAVVLATSQLVYDRYVVSRAYCPMDQQTNPAWVPTRDNPQCFVGYTCYDPTRDRR